MEYITTICSKNNLDIIVTPSSGVYPARELFNNVTYAYSTIEGWLENITYSDLNITTSFHGVVFSILFNKNFVYIPLRNTFSKANNRVFDLLDILNLRCKILTSTQSIDEVARIRIKWDEVNKILEDKRKDSLSFLEKAIK